MAVVVAEEGQGRIVARGRDERGINQQRHEETPRGTAHYYYYYYCHQANVRAQPRSSCRR